MYETFSKPSKCVICPSNDYKTDVAGYDHYYLLYLLKCLLLHPRGTLHLNNAPTVII